MTTVESNLETKLTQLDINVKKINVVIESQNSEAIERHLQTLKAVSDTVNHLRLELVVDKHWCPQPMWPGSNLGNAICGPFNSVVAFLYCPEYPFFFSSKTKNPYALYIPSCRGLKEVKSLFLCQPSQSLFRDRQSYSLALKAQTNKGTNRTIFCCGEVCCQRWYAIFDGKS